MFDDTHYVPVLRWKNGERGALTDLTASDRQSITPLIELLPDHMRPRRSKHGPATSDDLWVAVEQLADTCGPSPVFLDVSRVAGAPYKARHNHAVASLFSALGAAGLNVIPTTWLNHGASFQEIVREAIKIDDRGVAIRIPITDLGDSRFSEGLRQLIAKLAVSPENVDVIVEYGLLDANAPTLA